METAGVSELVAALAYGQRLASGRARELVGMAPDQRTRREQIEIASREERNSGLLDARLAEVGSIDLTARFEPFFDAFFLHTVPGDWVEGQAFQYVGDALVSDFAEFLESLLDPVSASIVRHTLGERQDQETFALDELARAMERDPLAAERLAAYARRIAGEALTQTRRALDASEVVGRLLGGGDGQKRLLLDLLDRHRARLDRLGIEKLEVEPGEDS